MIYRLIVMRFFCDIFKEHFHGKVFITSLCIILYDVVIPIDQRSTRGEMICQNPSHGRIDVADVSKTSELNRILASEPVI